MNGTAMDEQGQAGQQVGERVVEQVREVPPQYPAPADGNVWGVAGFVVSVVGFISCGTLSPFGVILSAIGMRKQPKGMAVAGLVLGLIGTVFMVVVVFVIGLGVVLATVGIGAVNASLEVGTETAALGPMVSAYQTEKGKLPLTVEVLDGLSVEESTDPWGNVYRVKPSTNAMGYELWSDGKDGIPDTADDVEGYPNNDMSSINEMMKGAGR